MEAYVTLLRTQVFSIGNKEGLPRLVVMAKVSADYGCSVETETHTGWNNTIKYGGKNILSNATSKIIVSHLQIIKHYINKLQYSDLNMGLWHPQIYFVGHGLSRRV